MKAAHDPTLFARIGLGVLAHLRAQRRACDGAGAAAAAGGVVLVSSARAGEGRSFVAQGLAVALAGQQGGSVAWVDASFGASVDDACGGACDGGAPVGLAQILALGALHGHAPAGPARLWRIARGAQARPELLYRPDAVRQGLAALRAGFALTVIDAPPLALCGALLAAADACVMVVDARRTSSPCARQALADAALEPAWLAGVVLNHRPRPVPRWLGGD